MDITYIGHSTVEVRMGNRTILMDPWFEASPRELQRLVPPAFKQEQIRKADIILISHDHFDHLDKVNVPAIAERTFAQVVGPRDALSQLSLSERQKVGVDEGDSFQLLDVDIEVVKAVHPQCPHPVGFIIRKGGQSFYFAGDTYDYYDMSRISVDLALLPIGGTYTMDILSAIKALKQLRARFVIPIHYNTFSKIQADPLEFAQRAKRDTRSAPIVLSPGQSFTV